METPAQETPSSQTPSEPAARRTPLQRGIRVVGRMCRYFAYAVGVYLLIALIGLIPVNNKFTPSPDGVEIFLTSSAIHSDIIVPIVTETIDWREHLPASCFSGDTRGATHAAIGWGDKGFYIGTPTWGDLKASTVINALLLPSDSCMHVTMMHVAQLGSEARPLRISVKQYEQLAAHIQSSFLLNASGKKILIEGAAYGSDDAFFEAHGSYHCFNTCNCWTGAAMRSAGIRTGWFTPLPKTMFLYLPG